MTLKRICVYCGSSMGHQTIYADAAKQLGVEFAELGITLVYGGASVGIMGTIADSVLDAGGEVFGVIPQSIVDMEVAHTGLTELFVVNDMHQRKQKMADLSDGFIALPGGMGTLEELFESLTWSQLNFHDKPCGVLNLDGYYDHLLRFLDHSVDQGFLRAGHRKLLLERNKVDELLNAMLNYQKPKINKLD